MHQLTSLPNLTHGRDSTKYKVYRARHSHQDLSPIENVWSVPKNKVKDRTSLSTKGDLKFHSAPGKISSASCRLHGMNCVCGTSENFSIQFHVAFSWF